MKKAKKTFKKTYNQYIEKIFRFIFLRVSSESVAQDLSSETFLRFWQTLNSGTEIQNPKAFIYQIARNLVIDHYREKNQAQFVPIEDIEISDPRADLEKDIYLTSDISQVQKAINELKPDYQDIIIWRYVDELSFREIANMLNKSEGAVRISLCRALEALRAIINQE